MGGNKRVQTALLLLIPIVAILAIGGWPLVALTLIVYARINYEFFSLPPARAAGKRAQLTVLAGLIPLGFLVYGWAGVFAGLLFAVVGSFLLEMLDCEREVHVEPHELLLGNAAMGLCYTGVLGTALVAVAAIQSQILIAWLLSCVIAADTLAYYSGRAFGSTKLAPRLSPAKTVEGAVGGIIGAVIASLLVSWAAGLPLALMGLWGLVVGVLAVCGDLIESMFKRMYGVKDTAQLLPGHGGLLDRVDALLFAAPVLFFLGA